MTPLALYTDGGCIGPNPSPFGGTWAWCLVDPDGTRVAQDSGVILAYDGGTVSNQLSELVAAIHGLEALPPRWNGVLYSDSLTTIRRLCATYMRQGTRIEQEELCTLGGVPPAWVEQGHRVLGRLGPFTGVLLGGHPTRADLARGYNAKGHPVSVHNVLCDSLCTAEAARWHAQGALTEGRG